MMTKLQTFFSDLDIFKDWKFGPSNNEIIITENREHFNVRYFESSIGIVMECNSKVFYKVGDLLEYISKFNMTNDERNEKAERIHQIIHDKINPKYHSDNYLMWFFADYVGVDLNFCQLRIYDNDEIEIVYSQREKKALDNILSKIHKKFELGKQKAIAKAMNAFAKKHNIFI